MNCVHHHPMGLDLQRTNLGTIRPDAERSRQGFQPFQGQLQSQGHQDSSNNSRGPLLDPFEMMASFRKVITWLKNNDFPDHDDDDNLSATNYDSDDVDRDDDDGHDDGNDDIKEIKPEMTKRKSQDTDFLLDGFDTAGSLLKRRKSAVEAQLEVFEARNCQEPSFVGPKHYTNQIILVAPW